MEEHPAANAPLSAAQHSSFDPNTLTATEEESVEEELKVKVQ